VGLMVGLGLITILGRWLVSRVSRQQET
jgi:hypothetical protein